MRKALAIDHLLQNMPKELKPDELIVGKINMLSVGYGREFPEYALPEEKEAGLQVGFNEKNVISKHPADYEKLLRVGIKGVKEEIYQKIQEEVSKKNPDEEKLNFWRALIISGDAVIKMAHGYADLCLKEAKNEKDTVRAQELIQIAKVCSRVPEYPAETFQEALQSFWFVFAALHSCMEVIAAARADQYLYPYYKKDIESGNITVDQATELVDSFFIKFSERVQMDKSFWEFEHLDVIDENYDGGRIDNLDSVVTMDNDEEYNYGTSANHWQQNIILAGQHADGSDATNDLSYIMLKEWADLELISPAMSVRFHEKSPEKLFHMVAEIVKKNGSGEPTIYNDAPIIQGLVKSGIPLEKARGYSNDGCWEVLMPGQTNYQYYHVQVLLLLEYLLHRGKSLVRGKVEYKDFGDPTQYKTFEEFYRGFLDIVAYDVDQTMKARITYWSKRYEIAPSVLLSLFMDNCIEKGKDISNGGARYSFYTMMLTGLANCVDSLMAIKKFIYDEKKITMAELITALETDFRGNEALRQSLIHNVPKFGNDNEEVDQLTTTFMKDFENLVNQRASQEDVQRLAESGFMVNVGCGTFESYANFGHHCGASPEGRHAQEAIFINLAPINGKL